VYTKPGREPTADPPERRGVSRRSVIEEAKARVETIALADLLCGAGQMRRVGERWVARCPLPDHEDRSPSFVVYPGDGGWNCFGCNRGGDVVNLAQLAWQIERADVAAAEVLLSFGHELPARPPSWFRKQERQRSVREVIHDARVEVMMRRLWRYIFEPVLADLEDAREREEVGDLLWKQLHPRVESIAEEVRRA